MSTKYSVFVEAFAERHYIKSFKKKYKNAWSPTWFAIEREFQNFETLLETPIAEVIVSSEKIRICKTEFRVAGTKESRHGSGNRCIVAVHADTAKVLVLLVYNKTHITGSGNETAKWKKVIKDNYSKYKEFL